MLNIDSMWGCGGSCDSLGVAGLGSILDMIPGGDLVKDAVSKVTGGAVGGGFPDQQTADAYKAGIAAGGTRVFVPELNRYVAQRPAGSQKAGEAMPYPDINADEYTKIMAMGTKVSPIAAGLTAYYRYWQASGGTKPSDSKGGILDSIFGGSKGDDGAAAAAAASQSVKPTKKSGGLMDYAPYVLLLAGAGYAARQARLI